MNQNNRLLQASLILSALLSLLFAYMFFRHNRELSCEYLLDNESVGQYGDFIGGLFGTILSVVLLYQTLNLQRKDSNRNTLVYEKQELNNEFYHLLSLYQEILKGFELQGNDLTLRGKELVASCYQDIHDGFDETETALRKMATQAYLQFYSNYRHFAPVYFRTLYRICENVSEKEKDTKYKNVEYIKVLRAQLTDAEMLLLRYNAQTVMGKKFRYYINKMNLLKHLPPLDLLEYKKWRKLISPHGLHEVSAINTVLVELRQRMADILDIKEQSTLNTFTEPHSLVTFAINTTVQKDELSIVMNRKNAAVIPDEDSFGSFLRFDKTSLSEMLSYFLYDSIVLMNFGEFNERKELDFSSEDRSPSDNSRFVLAFTVKNIKHNAIIMKWIPN